MNSSTIRQTFFDFFKGKTHDIVASAPMVIKDDPTLMFTNAGMNQFKDIFLGNKPAKSPRAANTQKCLRVSGKHNDLEEVGVDTYHHTMFEMLGNWSFGDYFKEEAIAWAWELLTEVYKIEKDRLYITVFEGDADDGLDKDQEAIDFWKTWVPEDRILLFDRKDNFWEMGEVGPCGPCSEIHIDLRNDDEREALDGAQLVNKDHPQVVEIWNLVFMQYNRMANRELKDLPHKHVDTGMGFERLAMVLQHKQSNYDTDVFAPLIARLQDAVQQQTGQRIKYGEEGQTDIAFRVIVDHVRAITFAIADGQIPSNTGAGYVIRRILRRAVRYGYSFFGLKSPFLCVLAKVVATEFRGVFPEVENQHSLIAAVIEEEEKGFLRTLDKGIARINDILKNNDAKVIDGKQVFELYDTYGFPVDLTALILRENGRQIDEEGFNNYLQQQKDRSRAATTMNTDDWVELLEDDVEEFVGYDRLEAEVRITRYRKVTVKDKDRYQLVFNITPFYAEGGGQVGDTGYIEANGEKVSIKTTKKENNLIIHFTDALPSDPKAKFKAVVNAGKRYATTNNHTATHLLHEALREVLGDHVEQKGSLVHPDYLRFDFSHFSKVGDEELAKVEQLVNQRVRANFALEEKRAVPMDEAVAMGAMALFGEKYGDLVRVIKFGDSVELCGGTHVQATGQLGYFKITTETAVAAGIRRIEAITGDQSQAWLNDQLTLLEELKALLKNPADVTKALQDLMQQNAQLSKQMEALNKQKAKAIKEELVQKVREVNGVQFLAEKVSLDAASVKDVVFQLKGQINDLFAVLGAESDGKATLTVIISDNLVEERELHAGNIVKELAKEIKGGGGGQKFFATAGGRNLQGIETALKKAEAFLS